MKQHEEDEFMNGLIFVCKTRWKLIFAPIDGVESTVTVWHIFLFTVSGTIIPPLKLRGKVPRYYRITAILPRYNFDRGSSNPAWHDSVKCFILLIERMNQWNETCHLDALQMRPGMGLVTLFWRHTSVIMHAWGATRIIAWMRYNELYQLGEFKFPTGPVHRHHLFLQKRYKDNYNNAAPFLTLQKPSVISNRTKDNKGFGDLIIAPNEDYWPYHWNWKGSVTSSGDSGS